MVSPIEKIPRFKFGCSDPNSVHVSSFARFHHSTNAKAA